MKTIYVAGPMRGRPYYNFPAFDAARDRLIARGYRVVSPADMDRKRRHFDGMRCSPSDPCTTIPVHRDIKTGRVRKFNLIKCIREDIDAVLRKHAVYALRGWEKSAGARAEVAVALWAGKEVIYEENDNG